MKPLILYHANCTDGFGAAFSAWCKFGDDHHPIFDANGKIQKGPNYKPADLEGLV
jgi:hypothetical protein